MTVPSPQKSPEPSIEYAGVPLGEEESSSVRQVTKHDLKVTLRYRNIAWAATLIASGAGGYKGFAAIAKDQVDAGFEKLNEKIDSTAKSLERHLEDEARAKQATYEEQRAQAVMLRELALDVRDLSKQMQTTHVPPRLLADPPPLRKPRLLPDGGVR